MKDDKFIRKYLFRKRAKAPTIVMEEAKDKLEKMYQKLKEEEDSVLRKWNESLIPKTILLFPLN